MPTTSNFGWTTPADTDLVKDGAAAIRTLGNGIDTSLVDLKGGTTGQILSKASNTDLDYTWITNDVGDITNVGVTAPITGGGSSGSVTIGIQDGTTAQKGAVQLENSTSSTSTTTAAVPASVKSAYDLANAAIPKSLVDAAGDLIYATANDTVARLALGTANQVLTVNSGATAPEWKTPASGGLTLLQTNTLSGSAYTTASISQDYKQLRIVLRDVNSTGADSIFFRLNSDTGSNYYYGGLLIAQNSAFNYYDEEAATQSTLFYENMSGNSLGNAVVNIYRYTDTDRVFYDFATTSASTSFTPDLGRMTFTGCGIYDNSAAITTITIRTNTGNVGGTMYVYGVS